MTEAERALDRNLYDPPRLRFPVPWRQVWKKTGKQYPVKTNEIESVTWVTGRDYLGTNKR